MARPKYPSDETDKTMVRFPPGLMPRLKEAAQVNGRSMNAEIVARLSHTLRHEEKPDYLEGRIARLEELILKAVSMGIVDHDLPKLKDEPPPPIKPTAIYLDPEDQKHD